VYSGQRETSWCTRKHILAIVATYRIYHSILFEKILPFRDVWMQITISVL